MFGFRRLWAVALAVAVAGTVACANDSTAPELPAPGAPQELLGLRLPLLDNLLGFVKCQPQPYAATSAAVGPAGGVLQVNGHKLTIPAGALDSTVVIHMEALADTIRSVQFAPEGLVFNAAHRPTLRMDYSNCSLLSLLSKRIVYTDDQWNLLEWLLSLDLLSLLKVEARLDHFSRYAIHY